MWPSDGRIVVDREDDRLHDAGGTYAKSRRSPGMPLRSCAPRSSKSSPDASASARVVSETSTSPAPADRADALGLVHRDAADVVADDLHLADVHARPDAEPELRERRRDLPAAQTIAFAGPSNVAIMPSPVVFISRPMNRSSRSRSAREVPGQQLAPRVIAQPVRLSRSSPTTSVISSVASTRPAAPGAEAGERTHAGPLDRRHRLVTDDVAVVAGRDVVHVVRARAPSSSRPGRDAHPSGEDHADVVRLAPLTADVRTDVGRPSPSRLEPPRRRRSGRRDRPAPSGRRGARCTSSGSSRFFHCPGTSDLRALRRSASRGPASTGRAGGACRACRSAGAGARPRSRSTAAP